MSGVPNCRHTYYDTTLFCGNKCLLLLKYHVLLQRIPSSLKFIRVQKYSICWDIDNFIAVRRWSLLEAGFLTERRRITKATFTAFSCALAGKCSFVQGQFYHLKLQCLRRAAAIELKNTMFFTESKISFFSWYNHSIRYISKWVSNYIIKSRHST